MKHFIFTLLIITALFQSCDPKIVPLKGRYSDGNFEGISTKTQDQVWDNLIELFAKTGITIRIIDKSSGLIIAGKTAMPWTYENGKGELIDKTAWIVIEKVIDPGSKKLINPTSINGEWNVRLKTTAAGTLININLVNPSYFYGSLMTKMGQREFVQGHFQSTGVFENMIFAKIK